MRRVLPDTNVFIFAIEHPGSNSSIIVEIVVDGEIGVVVSEEIRLELVEYMRSEYGKDAAYRADLFLNGIPSFEVVDRGLAGTHAKNLKGLIKDKDLPHLAAAEAAKVDSIVSYDRDFKRAKTKIPVLTPREFVEDLGIEPFENEY